jgi:hypothetical protein
MKLTKDNYELVMFDLLEGNLEEAKELEVMAQIEADEFFFREWKLFKSTILVADEGVVYTNKQGLMKKAPVIIPMYRWASVAVAASLVIGLIILWPRENAIEVVETTPKTEIITPENTITPEELPVLVEDNEEESLESELPKARNIARTVNQVNNDTEEIEEENIVIDEHFAKDEVLNEGINVEEVELPKEELKEERFETPEVIADNLEPKNLEEISTDPIPQIEDNQEIKPDYIASVAQFVTNKPKERIKDKASEFIAKVSNPKLRFKPQFVDKKPGLQIEFESTGYLATANLQPFNNK